MDRRDFLKSSGALLAGLSMPADPAAARASLPTGVSEDMQPNPMGGRLVLSLNRDWRFSAQPPAGATARDFEDSAWESVTVPHANRRLPWHGFDEKSSQVVPVYRRRFRLPKANRGQHVFADFAGAMTATTVWINGAKLGEYRGGYTPFSFELTPQVDWDRENVLVVELDSSERADIPPFGGEIDYLTFGGIYRDVSLRLVPPTYLENIFARATDVMTDQPHLEVSCFVARLKPEESPLTLEVELRDGDRPLAVTRKTLVPAPASAMPERHDLTLVGFGRTKTWDLFQPYLYTVVSRIRRGGSPVDENQRRIGFREACFTESGSTAAAQPSMLLEHGIHRAYIRHEDE